MNVGQALVAAAVAKGELLMIDAQLVEHCCPQVVDRAGILDRIIPEFVGCSVGSPATHPATGDQLVTRSEWEASDLGYEVDGVLGYAYDPPVDLGERTGGPAEIPWGSRLGRVRRRTGGPDVREG